MARGYLSIGSNLGEREFAVLRAARLLGGIQGIEVHAMSSLYETEPVGCPGQPSFINMVVEVHSLLSSLDLLKRLKELEAAMGRRGAHNAPREVDIDIITMGEEIVAGDELVLPHPRYHERGFVLVPLREIEPGFVCPRSGRSLDTMISALAPQGRIERVSSREFIAVTSNQDNV